MRNNCVAIIDIRSADMTAVVGERGVNGTFIIKSKYTCAYDGFAEGELIDAENFISTVSDVVRNTLAGGNKVKNFYVGVPGEFTKITVVDKVLSFHSAKKINASNCSTLIDLCTPPDSERWRVIRHSCLYYVLSDKRKVINPIGAISDSLQGKCCFYLCNDAFMGCVMTAFRQFKNIASVNFIPTVYAEAMYLVEPERRDECAVLFDFGYISSTYSVICGNGLLYSESFSVGIGHIAYYLASELDVPFDVASSFLSTVNLNVKEKIAGMEECVYEGKSYRFPTVKLRDVIKEGLDGVCETIEECRQNFTSKNIDGKPLLITGEGVKVVRGTAEHLSDRLVKGVEVIAPKVPYYDKPHYSSLLSLLDTALDDNAK